MVAQAFSLFPQVEPDLTLGIAAGRTPNCGIILTNDGSFKLFDTCDPDVHTNAEIEAHAASRRKLVALAVALSNEQLMAILYDVAENTDALSLLENPDEEHAG